MLPSSVSKKKVNTLLLLKISAAEEHALFSLTLPVLSCPFPGLSVCRASQDCLRPIC